MKLTPIYPAHIKPVRKGVYKVRPRVWDNYAAGYAFWDGKQWGQSEPTTEYAEQYPMFFAAVQNKRWQGLTTKDGK